MNKNKILSVFLATASCLALGEAARAQILSDEMVVTAQRKEENLQAVGIAVTAFNGEQIEKLGFQNTTDLVYQTPGMQLYEFSPTITVYNIRGVSQNSFSDNLEGPIAVYMDDVYISALGALNQPMYDLERVEVLKGPQGTLYGRNATGGLVHYISRRPTDEFEFRFKGSYASYNRHEIEAAISGPLAKNIRARLAVSDIQEDGYLKSTRPDVRDAYGKNSTAAKAFVEVDLDAATMVTINPYWVKDRDVPTGAYTRRAAIQDPATGLALSTPFPDNVFQHTSDVQGQFDREIYGVTGKIEHEFAGGVKATSITNYYHMDKFYKDDSDATDHLLGEVFPYAAGAPFASLGGFQYTTTQAFKQFSQELRFAGDTDLVSWQAGAYFLDISQRNSAAVEGYAAFWTDDLGTLGYSPEDSVTVNAQNDFSVDSQNISVFAQGEFHVSDRVKAIAGLRWVHDDKEIVDFKRYIDYFTGETVLRTVDDESLAFYGADGTIIGPICYSTEADPRCPGDTADPSAHYKYNDVAGKFQVDFALTDAVLIYAGVNRGTKGGNWAVPTFPDSVRVNPRGLDALPHKEETLWSYEGGLKSTLFNGRGRFNAAVFYYDYNDYQAFSVINFVQNITNNKARVVGGEFEFAVNPMDGLDLLLGGSFLDTEVKGIVTPNGSVIDTEMPNAPAVSLNGLARYAWNTSIGEFSVQVDGNYNGDQYLEVANSASSLQSAYFVGNTRLGFAPRDNIDISFWVRNFTNEEYRVYSLDVAGAPSPFINDVFARPRTYGGTLSVSF